MYLFSNKLSDKWHFLNYKYCITFTSKGRFMDLDKLNLLMVVWF